MGDLPEKSLQRENKMNENYFNLLRSLINLLGWRNFKNVISKLLLAV